MEHRIIRNISRVLPSQFFPLLRALVRIRLICEPVLNSRSCVLSDLPRRTNADSDSSARLPELSGAAASSAASLQARAY